MSGSQSKSSSKSTTQTTNTDNRVVAESDSIVINAGSSLSVTDEFPVEVRTLVYDILTMVGDVGNAALDVTKVSISSVNSDNEKLGERLTEIEQGGTKQFIGIAALAVVAIIAIAVIKKRKT